MLELWINFMHHHMDDTLQEIEQPRKFSSQVFIGQLYSETVLNGLNIVKMPENRQHQLKK